jgi:hypothetical protein
VPGRVLVVPSPQFTIIPLTVAVLETVKVTVTVAPVFAGLGVGFLTVTVGTLTTAFTITLVVPLLPEWLASPG